MASILDNVRMAERVSSATGPEARRSVLPIESARDAVIDFLNKTLPDVRHTNIVKLALLDPEQGTWEAEAEVQVPNATVKALGLPTRRPVLDRKAYLLRLDDEGNVTAYGLTDSVERGK
jgi:hypothetical protein